MDWFLDLNQDPVDIDTGSTYAQGFQGPSGPVLQNQNAYAQGHGPLEDVGESPDLLEPIYKFLGGGSTSYNNQSGTMEQTSSMPTSPANNAVTDEAAVVDGNGPEPMVDDEEALSQPQEPYLGMRFDTLEDAKDHYNAYAKKVGFSIKRNITRSSAITKLLEKQQFACNKYKKPVVKDGTEKVAKDPPKISLDDVEMNNEDGDGDEDENVRIFDKPKKKTQKRKRERIIPTGCKAKMVVKEIEGRWQVIHYVGEHNHECVTKPDLKKYLRSHQGIPEEEKEFLTTLHNCNLPTGRMFSVMAEYYGKAQFVPYNPRTVTNFRATLTAPTREFDLAEVQDYFYERKREDPDFFFKMKLDVESKVQNLFWVDALARKAYSEAYSDCISFDATYLTNMYNMPFAPFIGINRHGQSFMLGCGFVRQELATSYDWLFTAFSEAMGGKAPAGIITDQDIAMKVSIARIFPSTVHRNCRFHIVGKSNQKMGSWLGRHPEIVKEFNDIVDFSMSQEEFEGRWYLFQGRWQENWHSHLDTLYEMRHLWVPCYFRLNFFPFLQSTQRSEGFNVVLKRYVNPHNSILNFVKQYEKIQDLMLVKQGGNDYRTELLEMDCWSPYPIEEQALIVYTRDIYLRFRTEFELIGRYNVRPHPNGMYELLPNREYVGRYGSRHYMVSANVEVSEFNCECCKMQRDGLPCCHILKVFTHIGIDEIPPHYIMKRWTQDAIEGEGTVTLQEPSVMPEQSKKELRYGNLSTRFQRAAKKCCVSDAAEAIANKHLRNLETEIDHMNMTRRKARAAPKQSSRRAQTAPGPPPPPPAGAPPGVPPDGSGSSRPRNPDKVSTRGRKKATRTVSALELQPKKVVKCTLCGSTEHNAATCLTRLL